MNEEIKLRIEKCNKYKQRHLDLKYMNLKSIPDEVFSLTHLKDLKLSSNNLTGISDDIVKLKNLRRIHLSCNDFEEFPKILLELPLLEHICFNGNNLKSIPSEIEKLDKLKELQLNGNDISSLPCELLNCNIHELTCSRNPLKTGNEVVRARGSFQVYKHLLNNLLGKSFVFTVPPEIQKPIKTYLLSFSDYMKDVKGIEITIETRSVGEGLSIDVKMNEEMNDTSFNHYLFEYMELANQGLTTKEFDIAYEIEKSQEDKLAIEHRLSQDISILEIQLRQSEFENNYLKGLVNKLVDKESQPVTLYVNQQLLNSPTTNVTVNQETEDFKTDFKQLIEELKNSGLDESLIEDAVVINDIDGENPDKFQGKWHRVNKFLKDCLSRGEKFADAIDKVTGGYERILSTYEKLQKLLKSIGINPEEIIGGI